MSFSLQELNVFIYAVERCGPYVVRSAIQPKWTAIVAQFLTVAPAIIHNTNGVTMWKYCQKSTKNTNAVSGQKITNSLIYCISNGHTWITLLLDFFLLWPIFFHKSVMEDTHTRKNVHDIYLFYWAKNSAVVVFVCSPIGMHHSSWQPLHTKAFGKFARTHLCLFLKWQNRRDNHRVAWTMATLSNPYESRLNSICPKMIINRHKDKCVIEFTEKCTVSSSRNQRHR